MGEAVRSAVYSRGLLDAERKLVCVEGHLEIPLRALDPFIQHLGEVVEQKGVVRRRRMPEPYLLVREKTVIPQALKSLLPRKWERVGDVLLLRFPPELRSYTEEVCEAYAEVLRVVAVLDASAGVRGTWREPNVELLWGRSTETVHKENGVLFKLDLRKVMFSSGNIDERVRMSRVCDPGEVVVDMFAGIGYFSLPMAIHSRPKRVYACEINPTAHNYLRENVRINRADVVVPLLGDCRDVAPVGVADRVVLGYLRDTHTFLPAALRTLRSGGWVHYHEGCPDEIADRPLKHLKEVSEALGMGVARCQRRKVKSYAPGVSHWVLDALIS